jgi:hypothetical protein
MGRLEKTLIEVSAWRGLSRGLDATTFRETDRLSPSNDVVMVVLKNGLAPGFPRGVPDRIRVTVEWSDAPGVPLPQAPKSSLT